MALRAISYWHEPKKINLPKDIGPEDSMKILEEYAKLDSESFVPGYVIMKHIEGAVPGTTIRKETLEILEQAVKEGIVEKTGAIAAGCVSTDLYRKKNQLPVEV